MNDTLLNRIRPVASRLRGLKFWHWFAASALLMGLIACAMKQYVDAGHYDGKETAYVLGGIFAIIGLLAAISAMTSYRDPHQVAEQIEEKFPSLDHRLLTGLEQGDESLGYLQQRVVQEAQDHARSHYWTEIVPAGRLFIGRLSGLAATLFLLAATSVLWLTEPTADNVAASSVRPATLDVVIEPGDTEVERGTSLPVTARFDASRLPDKAILECTFADQSERRITMTQNLSDPILGGFLASVDQPLTYRVVALDWQSKSYTVDVYEHPTLVRSDAVMEYPEYTGLDIKRVEDTVRVSAVEGTKLTWECFLNKEVDTAELVAEDGTRIALTPGSEPGGAYTATLEIHQTQRLTLELLDDAGRANKFPPELIARMLPNQPPNLKLTQGGDASVSPLEELPLAAEVHDDFGISKVGLSLSFADQPTRELTLAEDIARGATTELQHLVEFEELSAAPDQLLSYHFWAEDVGPDGQPRRTQSDMYFAEVRPFEEIFREGNQPPGGQQQQQQQNQSIQDAQELAELQKEIINATWRVIRDETGGVRSEGFSNNVELLVESQSSAIDLLKELEDKVDDPKSGELVQAVRTAMETALAELGKALVDKSPAPLTPAMNAERAAYSAILKLRAREIEVVRSQQSQSSSSSASQQKRQRQLEELELDQEENRYETERQAQEDSEQAAQQKETRQILSRLRELARRQEDLNKEIAQLQSALEEAETKEEREEIERQLKRLREQQQDLLRETDELAQRMQSPENQQRMQEASEQLDETRENVRKASEALENNDTAQALAAGRRAERQFEELRDEFRRDAAGQFNDAMREMRRDAQELDEKEDELAQQLEEINGPGESAGLREDQGRESVTDQIDQQRERLADLLEKMQQTVEEADTAEPLLAQSLYDSFRETRQRQVDRQLRDTGELLRRGFDPEAQQMEELAGRSIDELRKDLEEAAAMVLGDETKALQRALNEIEQLERALDAEMQQKNPGQAAGQQADSEQAPGGQQQGQPAEPGESQSQQSQQGGRQGEPSEQPNPTDSEAGGQQSGSQQSEQRQSEQQQSNSGQPGAQQSEQQQSGSQQSGQQQNGGAQQPSQRSSLRGGNRENPQANRNAAQSGGGPDNTYEFNQQAPLTGDGFREWSDRLRDVEEMVDDAELRSQAARIRDRAREVRKDLRRHGKEPQWELVDEMIAEPLRELKRDVSEELMRRSAEKNAPIPIDRDPVPDEFTDAVQRYYESLGSGR